MAKKRLQFGVASMMVAILVAACVFAVSRTIQKSYLNGHEWKDVQGMSADDVRRVLGEPDSIRRAKLHQETWIYQAGFGVMGVEFENGTVCDGWYD